MENFIFLLSESWSATSAAGQFFSILRFLAATVFVALLAYYVTKMMAGKRGLGRGGGNISLIETINVGGQAMVQLIKAGDKFLVIGVTKERVTILSEIDKEHINEPEPINFSYMDTPFGKVLSKFTQPKEKDDEGDE